MWAPLIDTSAASVLGENVLDQLRRTQLCLLGSFSPFCCSQATLLMELGKCLVLHWASCLVTWASAENCSVALCPDPVTTGLSQGPLWDADTAFLFSPY